MVANPFPLLNRVTSRPKLPQLRYQSNLQPLDYKQVFSEALELCDVFSAPTKFDLTNISGCLKRIRIQNLYGCVRREVGGTTPYSMQRIFESGRPGEAKRTNNSNKWRGYDRGRTMPNLSTMARIEEISGVDFNPELHQLLWIAMDMTVPLGTRTRALLRSLNAEIREPALLIYMKMLRAREPSNIDIFEWCNCLSSEAGLPALSALTLLFRKAVELGDRDATSTIYWSLFQMLLVLGQELQQRGIAYLLYPFYLKHILSLRTDWELNESAQGMARMSMVLNLLAFVDAERSCVGTRSFTDRVKNMYRWLNSLLGFVPAAAFDPMFRPSKAGPSQSYVSDRQWLRNLACRTLIGIIATGRAPMVFSPDYLDLDLDFSLLAGHGRDRLLDVTGRMLVS